MFFWSGGTLCLIDNSFCVTPYSPYVFHGKTGQRSLGISDYLRQVMLSIGAEHRNSFIQGIRVFGRWTIEIEFNSLELHKIYKMNTVTSNLLSTLSKLKYIYIHIVLFIYTYIRIYIYFFFVAQQHLVGTKTLYYVGKVPGKFMDFFYCCKKYVKLQT